MGEVLMSLLILGLVAVVAVYVVELIPLPAKAKQIAYLVVGVMLFLQLLAIFGLISGIPHYRYRY